MAIPRIIGILVFFGVPAIIGGGITYHLTGDYVSVFSFEFLLIMAAGGFVGR
jgi:hypothetical protein